jgi:hypothetical protein
MSGIGIRYPVSGIRIAQDVHVRTGYRLPATAYGAPKVRV